MQGRSSNSAAATYLDRQERIAQVREAACRAARLVPSIRQIILFGSLVTGVPTPKSDADLLVIVADSPHTQPRDRVPEVLGALRPLPCPVDLFVLTQQELDRLQNEGEPLVREAMRNGMGLL